MADITINLLASRNSVPTLNDISLQLNQNEFFIVAGEENATSFEISYPSTYSSYEFYVELVNAAGAGINATKLEENSEADWIKSATEFVLPAGMAVAGYTKMSIMATDPNDPSVKVVWIPVKVKVHNTIPTWHQHVSAVSDFYIIGDNLYYESDGIVTNLGSVRGRQGPQGETGEQGIGYFTMGGWVSGTRYQKTDKRIDVVTYQKNAYYCKVTNTSTTPPDRDATNWGLLVEGGGGVFYFGTGVTGTSVSPAVFPLSGVSKASIGDVYWNMSNGVDRGNIYKCVVSGAASVAQWQYTGNISTVAVELDSTSSTVNYTLEPNTEKTFNAQNLQSVTITVPSTTYQGFISEVDVFIGNNVPNLTFVNQSGKPLKFTRFGKLLPSNYSLSSGSVGGEVNLLFRDNGASVVCAVLELT